MQGSVQPEVVTLTTGVFQQNGYVVADSGTKEAVIVDPGEDAGLFLRRLEHEGWTLGAIWLTHAHLDHILGVKEVVKALPVPIFLHPADRPLYEGAVEQGEWLGLRPEQPPGPDRELAHGDVLTVGRFSFDVRHVPGHSPGSVALVGHGVALVGDAVFAGSIGRTDLPGGDTETLLTSIRVQLLSLPDDTILYPGHGPATTVGNERRSNPFLAGVSHHG